MPVSQAFKDRLDDDLLSYRVKFYIEDSAAIGSKEWVDFSDRLEFVDVNSGTGERQRLSVADGVNRFMKGGTISHKTEAKIAGNTFITSIQSITVENSDGFWDDPIRWNDLKNIRGASTVFTTSQNNQEILLDKLKCKITLELVHVNGSIEEGTLGVFMIRNVQTNSNTGTATLQIADQSFFLKELDASEVKNGRSWYEQRPVKFLIEELLKQEPLHINSSGAINSDFVFPDVIRIPTSDESRVLSSYGRPPEWDGTKWNDGLGLFCRALVWGSVTMSDSSLSSHTGQNRLFLGLDNELWLWNPATDTYTKLATLSNTSLKIRFLKIISNIIYGVAINDPSGTDWVSTANFFRLDSVGTALEGISGSTVNTFTGYNSQMHVRRGIVPPDSVTTDIDIIPAVSALGATGNGSFGGENLFIPFTQRIRSIAKTDASWGIFLTTFSSETPSLTNVNFILDENQKLRAEHVIPGFYRAIGVLQDTDITALTYNNLGGGGEIKIVDANNLTGSILATRHGTAGYTDGDELSSPVRLAITGLNSIAGNGTLVITGALSGSKTFKLTTFGNDTAYLGYNSVIYQDSNYTIFNTANGSISDGVLDLEFSFGSDFLTVYNSSKNALITFEAKNKVSTSAYAYIDISIDGRVLSDNTFLSEPDGVTNANNSIIPEGSFKGLGPDIFNPGTANINAGSVVLQPTALETHPTLPEIYIGSVGWNNGDFVSNPNKADTYLHRFTLDSSTNSLGSTTTSGGATGKDITVAAGGESSFAKGDIIKVGTDWVVVASTATDTIKLTESITYADAETVQLMGKCLFTARDSTIITNIKHRSSGSPNNDYVVMSIMHRDRLGRADMYRIGLKDVTLRDNTEILDIDDNSGFSPSAIRNIVEDVDDNTKFYYYTADGRLYQLKIPASPGNVGTTTLLSDGFQAVENDPNLISNLVSIPQSDMDSIDGETRTTNNSLVMGVSAPTFLNETQPSDMLGKYYLWKYDQFMTDRIPLADFTGMNVWQAIGKLAQVPDYLVGFDLDERGSFFLTKKDNDSSASVLHTFENSAIKSNLITITKERATDSVYNYVSANPYFTKVGALKFELRTIPRANKVEEDSLLKKDDIFLSAKDNRKKSIRMICVSDGNVASNDLEYTPLFSWIEYDREIEARIVSPITADSDTILTLGSLFRGGNSGGSDNGLDSNSEPIIVEDGINIGDFAIAVDVVNNVTVVRRIIALNDKVTGFPTITINAHFGLTGVTLPRGTIIKIQKGFTSDSLNTRKNWSSDGVTYIISDVLNTTTRFEVNSVKDLSVDTVIAIEGKGTSRISEINEYDADFSGPTIIISTALDSIPAADDIIKAFYSPYDSNGSSTFIFQEVGGSNIFVKIAPTVSTNNQLRAGDILTLTAEGLTLEPDNQSTLIASSINTRSGRQEIKFDNKFMNRRLLKEKVFSILDANKDPKYKITAEGGILPYLTFVDTSGELVRFKAIDKKLFKNLYQNAVKGYPQEITHDLTKMTTKVVMRDEKAY